MSQVHIHRDPRNPLDARPTGDEFPWYFTVEHDPPRPDAYDYGSVETFERAVECAEAALHRRDAEVSA